METILVCAMIFIALPWILFHYITQWKKSTSMTGETARRLEERLGTVERIIAADNPDYRALRSTTTEDYRLEGRN